MFYSGLRQLGKTPGHTQPWEGLKSTRRALRNSSACSHLIICVALPAEWTNLDSRALHQPPCHTDTQLLYRAYLLLEHFVLVQNLRIKLTRSLEIYAYVGCSSLMAYDLAAKPCHITSPGARECEKHVWTGVKAIQISLI